ncbi:hypothetical protein [Leclercia adecarboxylata]|uniref:hypothetical protein n=1 Tax=Leclercia adecarboxylata TaxID=83655 RepID=UPI002B2C5EBF|nr:hypothetical protein NRF19_08200 [Leclercia adecarboxylata]
MKFIYIMLSAIVLPSCSSNSPPSNTTVDEFMQQYAFVKKNCERMIAARNTYYTCEDSKNNMLLQPVFISKPNPDDPRINSVLRATWGPYEFKMNAPYQVW